MANKITTNKQTGVTINIIHKTSVGTRIDITGYIFELSVKKNDTTDAEVISKEITTHTNAAQGETQVPITISDLATIDEGQYFYWILVKENVSAVPRISERGVLEVE